MLTDKITDILQERSKKSGGHNGSYIPELLFRLNIKYAEVKEPLNQLFKEKKITIRSGSQGKLIFWREFQRK